MNKKEIIWWNKFRCVLNEMPESLEVLVGAYGEITLANRGATRARFESTGHADNIPTIAEAATWFGVGVENNGTSL